MNTYTIRTAMTRIRTQPYSYVFSTYCVRIRTYQCTYSYVLRTYRVRIRTYSYVFFQIDFRTYSYVFFKLQLKTKANFVRILYVFHTINTYRYVQIRTIRTYTYNTCRYVQYIQIRTIRTIRTIRADTYNTYRYVQYIQIRTIHTDTYNTYTIRTIRTQYVHDHLTGLEPRSPCQKSSTLPTALNGQCTCFKV